MCKLSSRPRVNVNARTQHNKTQTPKQPRESERARESKSEKGNTFREERKRTAKEKPQTNNIVICWSFCALEIVFQSIEPFFFSLEQMHNGRKVNKKQ